MIFNDTLGQRQPNATPHIGSTFLGLALVKPFKDMWQIFLMDTGPRVLNNKMNAIILVVWLGSDRYRGAVRAKFNRIREKVFEHLF